MTENTHDLLRDRFILEEREPLEVKGKGVMRTYFILREKD